MTSEQKRDHAKCDMAAALAVLIAGATDEDLSDDGRYFSESLSDVTQCRHCKIGEYQRPQDGKLVEWLWNKRHVIHDILSTPTPADAVEPVCPDCGGNGYSGGIIPLQPELSDGCETCSGGWSAVPAAWTPIDAWEELSHGLESRRADLTTRAITFEELRMFMARPQPGCICGEVEGENDKCPLHGEQPEANRLLDALSHGEGRHDRL